MPVWEAYFGQRYKFPLTDFSEKYPECSIYSGCVGDRIWLRISPGHRARLLQLGRTLSRDGGRILSGSPSEESDLLVFDRNLSRTVGINPIFVENHCQLIPPWSYRNGWGFFRVQVVSEVDLRTMSADLAKKGTFRLLRKSEIATTDLSPVAAIRSLFSDLTDRQAEALLRAHRAGYYRSPREVTRADIAKQMGLGRTTLEEHLRKAERKLMNGLIPLLAEDAETAGAPRFGLATPKGSAGSVEHSPER
jgi:predicted DNA binding protein